MDRMDRQFVIVTGLPGSGKTSLACRLAPLLNLPVIDKDEILEGLFRTKGEGDLAWRRALSRESDIFFRDAVERSNGGIVVSFWHLPGMPRDSGTPTGWLTALSRNIVNLHCECPPTVAAERYCRRQRHPGHLDHLKSREEVLAAVQTLAGLDSLEIGVRVTCDTSQEIDLPDLATGIAEAFVKA